MGVRALQTNKYPDLYNKSDLREPLKIVNPYTEADKLIVVNRDALDVVKLSDISFQESNFTHFINNPMGVCFNSLYNGIDWLYSFSSSVYAFEYRIMYFQFMNSIFDESFDFFFNSFWFFMISVSPYQLYWSVLVDNYFVVNLHKFYFTESWFRSVLASQDTSLIFVYNPELLMAFKGLGYDYYGKYFSSIMMPIHEALLNESYVTPIMLLPQLMVLTYFSLTLVVFFFSYYSSLTKDEVAVDADFLVASATVEAEKEIGSMDDMIMSCILLVYIFGWYFYINFYTLLSNTPEFMMVLYLFPGLYFIILSIPTFLSYDFGIFFLAFLRGVGASPVLIFELMYDYIAFAAFYIRLCVQGVRLVLMLFTYASMHDLILFFNIDQRFVMSNQSIWDDVSNLSFTFDSFSYFLLLKFPSYIVYWFYEVLHTFFVITGQFVAFFAMVFWLFLFLYSFFVIEKSEAYFKERREYRKKLFKEYYDLKGK